MSDSASQGPPRAAIVSIGDEITLGQNLDTNSRWLAERLCAFGALPIEHTTVPDDEAAIAQTFERLSRGCSIVVCTGGLGPTADDLTRQALARAMGQPLVEDAASLERLTAFLALRKRPVSPLQRSQVLRPASAASLVNEVGTAPGLRGVVGACEVFCLPGPPPEMREMFEHDVAPALRALVAERARATGAPPSGIATRFIRCCGIAEADAAQKLGAILHRDRTPAVGITVAGTIVTLRIRHEGSLGDADRALDDTERAIREAMGDRVFGVGEVTLAGAILRALTERAQTVACVESCTAGMLGAALAEPPGASKALLGGWITYSNEMKQREVGVPEELLRQHGAVSAPVACAMAEGGLHRATADHCVAITGIAGPTGGSEAKPVGTVFIALASRGGASVPTDARRFFFAGDRTTIRTRATQAALTLLWFRLTSASAGRLVGETTTSA